MSELRETVVTDPVRDWLHSRVNNPWLDKQVNGAVEKQRLQQILTDYDGGNKSPVLQELDTMIIQTEELITSNQAEIKPMGQMGNDDVYRGEARNIEIAQSFFSMRGVTQVQKDWLNEQKKRSANIQTTGTERGRVLQNLRNAKKDLDNLNGMKSSIQPPA